MSKPIDQEREAFEEKLASIAITIQGVQRMLQDLSLKRWPDNNHDLTGDYVNANINHAAQGAKTHLPALNEALIAIGDLFADDTKPAGVAVPEGWKLIPSQPNEGMLNQISPISGKEERLPYWWYQALIKAAPTPPASEQQQVVVMPEGSVLVGKSALALVRNSLKRDAESGLQVRGEILSELDQSIARYDLRFQPAAPSQGESE